MGQPLSEFEVTSSDGVHGRHVCVYPLPSSQTTMKRPFRSPALTTMKSFHQPSWSWSTKTQIKPSIPTEFLTQWPPATTFMTILEPQCYKAQVKHVGQTRGWNSVASTSKNAFWRPVHGCGASLGLSTTPAAPRIRSDWLPLVPFRTHMHCLMMLREPLAKCSIITSAMRLLFIRTLGYIRPLKLRQRNSHPYYFYWA